MNPHYESVAERAGHRCEYCCAPEEVFNFPFEVEHITPRAQGGADDSGNLALACRSCNLFKWSRTTGFDDLARRESTLFNPRQQNWSEHFQVELESGQIIGLTSIGRATVQCLQINSPAQLHARRSWMRLNLFP